MQVGGRQAEGDDRESDEDEVGDLRAIRKFVYADSTKKASQETIRAYWDVNRKPEVPFASRSLPPVEQPSVEQKMDEPQNSVGYPTRQNLR